MPTTKKAAEESNETMTMDSYTIGRWVFLVGLVLAIIIGLIPSNLILSWFPSNADLVYQIISVVLLLCGFVGGLFLISKEEESHFVILSVGIYVFYQALGNIPTVGDYLTGMFGAVTSLFLSAAIVAIFVRNVISWFVEKAE